MCCDRVLNHVAAIFRQLASTGDWLKFARVGKLICECLGKRQREWIQPFSGQVSCQMGELLPALGHDEAWIRLTQCCRLNNRISLLCPAKPLTLHETSAAATTATSASAAAATAAGTTTLALSSKQADKSETGLDMHLTTFYCMDTLPP